MTFWKWINRHTRLYSLMGCILSGILVLIYLLALGSDTLFRWDSIALLVVCVVVVVFFECYAMHVESLAVIAARGNCDPEPLLESARQIRARRNPRRRRERVIWFLHTLNEMAALSDIGDLSEAEARLEEAAPWLSKMPPLQLTLFSMNRACLYLMQKKPEAALSFLRESDAAVEAIAAKKRADPQWQASLQAFWWEYRFQTEGPSEELLGEMRRQAASADTLQLQVALQCKLAACLLALNRRAEAVPYLRFVADHGGKLWQRQWAVEQLAAGSTSCDTPV